MAFEKRPKYWLARAFGGDMVLVSTKARPNPGLVEIWGKMEKTKEVEKEEMLGELEVGFMVIMVG